MAIDSLDFPQTALSSIVKESKRMYDIVKDVFFKSLSLKNEDLIENYDYDLLKLKLIDSDEIEKLYNKNIKNLYIEIIDYIIKTEINNAENYYENFNNLKTANRRLV
ncbi:MAG: hypothetical protein Q8S84_05205 [bacterium]|nr:hypothetical protein [bacterium]MDP3380891.1 hypothetical protein [bacterium]